MPEALIRPELVQLGAAPADKTAAIRQAGQLLVAAGCIAPAYVQSLLAREQTANTYLGSGVAIPHGQIADRHLIERTGIAVLQVPGGVEWNAGQRATLIFAIAAQSDEHLALLRRLTRLLQDEATLQKLACTADAGDILRALELPAAPAAAADAAAQAPAIDYAQGFDWRMPYPNGLHARPAQQWVETARRFAASVRVRNGQEAGDAKNLMALLQLGGPAVLAWMAWGVALMFLLWSLNVMPRMLAQPASVTWWALSFPLAAFAALSLRLAGHDSGVMGALALLALAWELWLAPLRPGPHRRRTRGASAQLSPARQPHCCPLDSARASSRMRPSWETLMTSTSRATRMVTTIRATATRRVISGPAVSSRDLAASRVLAVASSRDLAASRETPAAHARAVLRRVAEAPVASLEARAVRTPPPRMRVRPPAER